MVISGSVTIRLRRRDGKYSESAGERLTVVPPGFACALYNYGDTEALVLNLPSPAWSKEQPDEWPVERWMDPEGWNPEGWRNGK
jgi:dTDP-4-dehydrorhamnose 3,5-epimerase-like enzyme